MEDFRRGFEVRGGELLVQDKDVEALEEQEVGKERIPRYVPTADKK
jgi:hypothetical protein